MTKFLSDLLVKGVLTAENGVILGGGKNISTTNQAYILSTNYTNGIAVGYDSAAVYLGYSMGSTPIHLGSNGSGNLVVRTSGNTIIENGALSIGQTIPESGTKLTVNGNVSFKNGYVYGGAANGGDFGLYPDGGYYEFSSPTGANQGPILILNCRYTGKQVGFYSGDTTYPGMLLYEQAPVGGDLAYWTTTTWAMTSSHNLVWASATGGVAIAQGPYDIGLTRESAGLLQVNNGTVGTYASLKALNLTATGNGNIAGNLTVTGKGSFGDHVTINTDPALFAGSAYNGYKILGVGSTIGGGLSFVSSNGIAAEIFGDNTTTGLYLASYGAVPVITFYLNTTEVGKFVTTGQLQLSTLAGSGNRMVVADSSGVLSTQAVPSAITNYVTTDTTQTITGQKTFSALTTIFDSNQTSTFIEGKASGVLYGGISFGLFYQFNAYPGATQGYLWKNGAGSNVMALSQTGVLNLATLAGTGTRMVVADTNGNISSQSIPTGSLQGAVDADKTDSGTLSVGTTTVKSVSASTYSGVFFDYVVKNSTNVRVGSVVAITNGSSVEFYETLSNDLGNTTGITFAVDLSAGNIRLRATTSGTGWTAIVSTRAI